MKAELSGERKTRIFHWAGKWFAEKGLIEESLHYFLAAGNVDDAAALVELALDEVINKDPSRRTLRRWLDMFPAPAPFRQPALAVAQVYQWNVVGWGDRDYSNSQVQLLFTFLPGGGWSVGSLQILNYDWNTNYWTIPLILNVGKTVMAGKTPVKLQLELNYHIEQPDAFGPEWMVSFNITPVVTNVVEKWIRGN